MNIPDDTITGYIGGIFGHSRPGANVHGLLIVTDDPPARTALGLPDHDATESTLYALAPDATVDTMQFVGSAVLKAIRTAQHTSRRIHFAGLAMEVHTTTTAKRRLYVHPAAIEATILYAVSSDRRRWTGRHELTGPRAGHIEGPTLHTGTLQPIEQTPLYQLMRLAVGMPQP